MHRLLGPHHTRPLASLSAPLTKPPNPHPSDPTPPLTLLPRPSLPSPTYATRPALSIPQGALAPLPRPQPPLACPSLPNPTTTNSTSESSLLSSVKRASATAARSAVPTPMGYDRRKPSTADPFLSGAGAVRSGSSSPGRSTSTCTCTAPAAPRPTARKALSPMVSTGAPAAAAAAVGSAVSAVVGASSTAASMRRSADRAVMEKVSSPTVFQSASSSGRGARGRSFWSSKRSVSTGGGPVSRPPVIGGGVKAASGHVGGWRYNATGSAEIVAAHRVKQTVKTDREEKMVWMGLPARPGGRGTRKCG
eukprot:scaffold30852_cov87-Isochrysis_galbana.AAC.1